MSGSPSEESAFPFNQAVVWAPDPAEAAETNLARFIQRHHLGSREALQARAAEDAEWFWGAVLDALDIRFEQPYTRVVDLSEGMAFPRWCVGGRMNIVHNLLDKRQGTPQAGQPALRWENEQGARRTLTYAELHAEVCRMAGSLRALGVRPGERVGLMMPMIPELVVGFLAVLKIGAIALPLFSGFGAAAAVERLRGAEAAMLLTATGFRRRGRWVGLLGVVEEALREAPSVRQVVVARRPDEPEGQRLPPRAGWWEDLPAGDPEQPTHSTGADDPMMIIYTSGTTGRPKGAVHTHCGFPVKAAQDLQQCMDVRPGETVFWMTDMGWMMGPWLVLGTLLLGATMMLYDGAPDAPEPDRVWALVDRHDVRLLGLSPTFVRAVAPYGPELPARHDLSRLRAVGSTGSPWDPESWRWLFRHVLEGRKPILNYSGGAEISGGILCGDYLTPMKPCAFSGPAPGMAADVVDGEGRPVRGAVGELALRRPWIGMARGFWRDPDRYLQTYWSRLPGLWVHGDFAAVDADGFWYLLGRSDDTINVAGKRIGPSEVEAVVAASAQVGECAAIGAPHPVKGEEIVVFVTPAPGVVPDEALEADLRARLRRALGKALAPTEIRYAEALPHTRNAKVMRRVIRAAYLGLDPGDVSALEDPEALEAVRRAYKLAPPG